MPTHIIVVVVSPSDTRERDINRDMETSLKIMKEHTRAASKEEYAAWLKGYEPLLAKSRYLAKLFGKELKYLDHRFSGARVLVATSDFHLGALYGARSVELIVPEGIKVTTGDLGHSQVMYMKDFTIRSSSHRPFVCVYTDLVFF